MAGLLVAVTVVVLGVLLVAGVVRVRPATAVDAAALHAASLDAVALDAVALDAAVVDLTGPDPAEVDGRPPDGDRAGPSEEGGLVLRRGGTTTLALGQAVADLADGWRTTGVGARGCEQLLWGVDGAGPGAADPPPAAASPLPDVRVTGWARDGRVVAVRLEAPTTPGVLLPTAVRTGWSLEAVLAGSDGLLHQGTARGPAGGAGSVLVGRLPPDAWPPAAPAVQRPGRAVAADPPPPAVDLVLGDAGTGRVVSAEVRVPAARGCPSLPDGA